MCLRPEVGEPKLAGGVFLLGRLRDVHGSDVFVFRFAEVYYGSPDPYCIDQDHGLVAVYVDKPLEHGLRIGRLAAIEALDADVII